ncbi:ADP-ribose pyrophosphatase YjhB, NUDIX family [Kaistia soli DSM 19436]|uniref:ADP-ribose pyrophosphatase YjhB, NUDIX family n=1 Tax=Kaistia soli DSM 19436 TaxID=1122133 RepID=A0A1M4Z9A4_9HYPH|nr:CoA pyrophosphatase [Kaistia soli]SHF14166.1 ADP-ribose pyrophosphatase YjhB, NUDIX family [Kaistia soli DSM 19436]
MTVLVEDDRFRPDRVFARAQRLLIPIGGSGVAERVLNPEFHPPHGFRPKAAAVLIPIVAREAPTVLMTRRTTRLRKHAGQISFPGGQIDPGDAGVAEAAMREAEEEVGLDPRLVQPIGRLDPYIAPTGYHITPVVARVDPALQLRLNPDEVEAAFEVPLAFLMTPENHRRGSREWDGARHFFYEMPYDEHYIWGITAGIIRGLYERVFA